MKGSRIAPTPATLQPEPEPVDRAALVNYATFLALERERVCAELYPHMGTQASRFVLMLNAAERFFYPDGSANDYRSDAWKRVPQPSTRALKVLDLVGIDWREDTSENSRRFFDESGRADTGERPRLPHGWPMIDAELVSAFSNLQRLDAAIEAVLPDDYDDPDDVPGYTAVDGARNDALDTLKRERAQGLPGLQAKARAILTTNVRNDYEATARLAQALARNLLGARQSAIEPRPDPIFAAIAECKRLEAIAHANEIETPPGVELSLEAKADASAVWTFIEGALLNTVPTTAAGCAALARFVPPLFKRWSACLDGRQGAGFFDLIARSPLL